MQYTLLMADYNCNNSQPSYLVNPIFLLIISSPYLLNPSHPDFPSNTPSVSISLLPFCTKSISGTENTRQNNLASTFPLNSVLLCNIPLSTPTRPLTAYATNIYTKNTALLRKRTPLDIPLKLLYVLITAAKV